jgi:hypothetical protein
MAKTSAQRQKDYRSQRPFAGPDGNGERRLNTWLSTAAGLALQRLAKHQGISQRQVLEQLLRTADENVINHLDPDTPAWDDYFQNGALLRNRRTQTPG